MAKVFDLKSGDPIKLGLLEDMLAVVKAAQELDYCGYHFDKEFIRRSQDLSRALLLLNNIHGTEVEE